MANFIIVINDTIVEQLENCYMQEAEVALKKAISTWNSAHDTAVLSTRIVIWKTIMKYDSNAKLTGMNAR